MAKILYKKKVYEYKKCCVDEFGKYNWYFNIYICFSKVGITWQISTSDMTVNDKKLKRCLDSVLKDLEEDNPRYYKYLVRTWQISCGDKNGQKFY